MTKNTKTKNNVTTLSISDKLLNDVWDTVLECLEAKAIKKQFSLSDAEFRVVAQKLYKNRFNKLEEVIAWRKLQSGVKQSAAERFEGELLLMAAHGIDETVGAVMLGDSEEKSIALVRRNNRECEAEAIASMVEHDGMTVEEAQDWILHQENVHDGEIELFHQLDLETMSQYEFEIPLVEKDFRKFLWNLLHADFIKECTLAWDRQRLIMDEPDDEDDNGIYPTHLAYYPIYDTTTLPDTYKEFSDVMKHYNDTCLLLDIPMDTDGFVSMQIAMGTSRNGTTRHPFSAMVYTLRDKIDERQTNDKFTCLLGNVPGVSREMTAGFRWH